MINGLLESQKLFETIMNEPCTSICEAHGGFTNKSYEVRTLNGHYILRVPGMGTNNYIDRKSEILNMKLAEPLGFVPKIFYANMDTGIVITQFVDDNIPMSISDISNQERLKLIIKRMVSLHQSGIQLSNEFNIEKEIAQYLHVLESMNVELPEKLKEWQPVFEKKLQVVFKDEHKMLVPCHCDPKLNNFLLQNDQMWMIDWEYSGMSEKYFDLVNIVMTNYLSEADEKRVINTYEMISGEKIDIKKYILYKIATDYLWIFWHLIKLYQGEMIEYNESSWKKRLERAISHLNQLEEI